MKAAEPHALLILNTGSSSIKFGIYDAASLSPLLTGRIQDLKGISPRFTIVDYAGAGPAERSERIGGEHIPSSLAIWLARWVADNGLTLDAAAHRIVSAMQHSAPVEISEEILEDIKITGTTDPEHSLAILELISACITKFGGVPQVALFDSAFHASLPDRVRLLPIPKVYRQMGIRRYGFHGLSYASIMVQVKAVYGQSVHNGKVVIAHLGNGSSLAAVESGICIDTTMSFSPTGGIPMSTRSGDLDPSIVVYLLRHSHGDTAYLTSMLNNESGLKAISGTTGDISALLQQEGEDIRAKDAVDMFCYQVRKVIGSYVAALGGLDMLVFTGGIGEHLPEVRSRICEGLAYMGIHIDDDKNRANQMQISPDQRGPMVCVLPSQEEYEMVRILRDFMIYKQE
ncbi:MAG: acetate/propionate family kinase [Bacteroidetes bacterium]|nr:acetate/propionate family kinase [Bacteroidota bacterium]